MYQPPRSRPLCKVYVGGLGLNGSAREIGNAFCCYGPLKKVWVARNPPGFAFVEFEDPEHAQNAIRALDGTILCGRRIKVAFANRNSRSSGGQSRNAPTRYDIQESCYTCGERGHYARDCFVEQIANAPTRYDIHESCYTCGERGHYARDCFVEQQFNMLENALELDDSSFDSDDDMEMHPQLYIDGDELYEFLERNLYDYMSSNNYQESFNQGNRNSARQQRRNERPEQQHRSNRSQGQHRNGRHQRQCRNNGPQAQSSSDSPQEQRNNQSQEQPKINSTPSCSPASSKTNNASNEVKCVICLDTVDDEMEYIPCGHGFHAKCCNEWLSVNDICPVCRTEVGSRVGIAQICPIS